MARIVLYYQILLLCVSSICSLPELPPEPNKHHENPISINGNIKNEEPEKDIHVPVIPINTEKKNMAKMKNVDVGDNNKNKEQISSSGDTVTKNTTVNSNIKTSSNTEIESGAVVRGVFVFMAITLLFIVYIAFKTYRRANKKNVIIKKYGVRTRRTDVEMEPLPLEEDEEDETVFDLGRINNR